MLGVPIYRGDHYISAWNITHLVNIPFVIGKPDNDPIEILQNSEQNLNLDELIDKDDIATASMITEASDQSMFFDGDRSLKQMEERKYSNDSDSSDIDLNLVKMENNWEGMRTNKFYKKLRMNNNSLQGQDNLVTYGQNVPACNVQYQHNKFNRCGTFLFDNNDIEENIDNLFNLTPEPKIEHTYSPDQFKESVIAGHRQFGHYEPSYNHTIKPLKPEMSVDLDNYTDGIRQLKYLNNGDADTNSNRNQVQEIIDVNEFESMFNDFDVENIFRVLVNNENNNNISGRHIDKSHQSLIIDYFKKDSRNSELKTSRENIKTKTNISNIREITKRQTTITDFYSEIEHNFVVEPALVSKYAGNNNLKTSDIQTESNDNLSNFRKRFKYVKKDKSTAKEKEMFLKKIIQNKTAKVANDESDPKKACLENTLHTPNTNNVTLECGSKVAENDRIMTLNPICDTVSSVAESSNHIKHEYDNTEQIETGKISRTPQSSFAYTTKFSNIWTDKQTNALNTTQPIDKLRIEYQSSPYAFTQILAQKLGGGITPVHEFMCLKFGLLLSLASITNVCIKNKT